MSVAETVSGGKCRAEDESVTNIEDGERIVTMTQRWSRGRAMTGEGTEREGPMTSAVLGLSAPRLFMQSSSLKAAPRRRLIALDRKGSFPRAINNPG